MAHLRDPAKGCPWDIVQDFSTIKPHTIEEAYEVADAIERGDMDDLKDELGDLLFQVIFHAQMATEQNSFTFDDVVDAVTKKMIFRHPHVFGDQTAKTAKDVKDKIWEQQKQKEKKTGRHKGGHYLDDVAAALPALLQAAKIQKRAHRIGFKFPSMGAVFDKLDEELSELKSAINSNEGEERIVEEFGDVLFITAVMGRHCGVENPEEALRQANLKFIKLFNHMEDALIQQGTSLERATIEDMTRAWFVVKKRQNS